MALSGVSFIVRIGYPIDTWKSLFGLIPTEVAHLPQYLSLFILGLLAADHDWLRHMPRRRGLIWLSIGLGFALLRYGYGLGGQALFPTPILAGGGWDWRSLLWSTWEAAICVGLCVGLLVLFREWGDRQGPLLQTLSANAYTVYLIHLLIVIGLQFLVADLSAGPLLKFAIVTLTGVLLCFVLSYGIRKLPFAQTIL
jgi:glucans biosynthesis protein C